MAKLLTLFIIQVAMIATLCAQSPFGTLGTKWTFEGWSEGSGWLPNWQGDCPGNELIFEVEDEIIINGITCGVIVGTYAADSLIVYQENGLVYFYEEGMFYKLYDFNAAAGDTIISFRPIASNSFSLKWGGVEELTTVDTLYTLVTGLDTTTINGIKLKRWTTEPIILDPSIPNPPHVLFETIIENIGSLNGIVGDHGLFIGEGCYGGFVCYESPGFTYGSYFFTLCDFTSSLDEIAAPQIAIYPNPTDGTVNIDADQYNIQSIEILDWSGKSLLHTNALTLDLRDFSPGLYFVRMIDDRNIMVLRKLVKH